MAANDAFIAHGRDSDVVSAWHWLSKVEFRGNPGGRIDRDEVDFVIEFDDGRVLAFEVKAKERISGADLKGLRKLRDALGNRLIAGVTLNTGVRSYTMEDRLHVMPLDRLWRSVHR